MPNKHELLDCLNRRELACHSDKSSAHKLDNRNRLLLSLREERERRARKMSSHKSQTDSGRSEDKSWPMMELIGWLL